MYYITYGYEMYIPYWNVYVYAGRLMAPAHRAWDPALGPCLSTVSHLSMPLSLILIRALGSSVKTNLLPHKGEHPSSSSC